MSSRSLLLLMVILTCLQCFTTANNAHGPGHCCFNYQKGANAEQKIIAYTETERQCTKPGVIFILNEGEQVCADPGVKWVKDSMRKIDQLNIKKQSTKSKINV